MRTSGGGSSSSSKAGGAAIAGARDLSEMSMTFRTVKVTGKNDFGNITINVDDKEIYVGSAFKIKWKHVTRFNVLPAGTDDDRGRDRGRQRAIELCDDGGKKRKEKTTTTTTTTKDDYDGKPRVFTMIGPIEDTRRWNDFATFMEGIWAGLEKKRHKKEAKRLEKEQEQLKSARLANQQSRRPRGGGGGGGGGAVYGRRYQQEHDKRERFLRANRGNMSYNAMLDDDDDDDVVHKYDRDYYDGEGVVMSDDEQPHSDHQVVGRGKNTLRGRNRKQSYEKMMDVEKIFANEDDDSIAGAGDRNDTDTNNHDDDDDGDDDGDADVDVVNNSIVRQAGGDHPEQEQEEGSDMDNKIVEGDGNHDNNIDDDASMSGGENDDGDGEVHFDPEQNEDQNENQDRQPSTTSNRSSVSTSNQTKNKKRKFVKLTKSDTTTNKQDGTDGDLSDDDDIFDPSPSMTTPSSQRVVSPGTSSRRRRRMIIDDDDDEEEEDDQDDVKQATAKSKLSSKLEDDDNLNDGSPKSKTPSVASFFKPVNKTFSKSQAAKCTVLTETPSSKAVQTKATKAETLSTPKSDKPSQPVNEKKPKKKAGDILDDSDTTTVDGDDEVSLNVPPSLKTSTKKGRPAVHDFFTPRNTKNHSKNADLSNDGNQSETATVVPGIGIMSASPGGFTVSSDHRDGGKMTPPRKKNSWYNLTVKSIQKSVIDSGELADDRVEEYSSSQSVKATPPPQHQRFQLANTSMKLTLTSGRRPRKKPPGARTFSSADNALDFADKVGSDVKFSSPLRTPSANRTPISRRSPQLLGRSLSPNGRSPVRALYQQPPADVAPSITWRGLSNIGNSCYMNASLQMLFSVPEFMLALSRYNGFAEPPELIQKLIGVWRNLNNKENGGGSFKPRALKLAIDAVTKKFQGSFQRDAHEFLGDLIDCIHEQNAAHKSSTPNDSQGDERIEPTQDSSSTTTSLHYLEPADEFFRLNVEVNLKCMSCGYSRCKNELYRNLSLDIDPSDEGRLAGDSTRSIQKSLDRFFSTEIREINCEKCEDGQLAEQTMRILTAPKALILHLKRFSVESTGGTTATTNQVDENKPNDNKHGDVDFYVLKKKNKVQLNQEISLAKYFKKTPSERESGDDMSVSVSASASLSEGSKGTCCGVDEPQHSQKGKALFQRQAQEQPTKPYEIRAVVHHIGKTADSGHYTADAVRFNDETNDEQWVSYDDAFTTELTADVALDDATKQKSAYMVLYSLRE